MRFFAVSPLALALVALASPALAGIDDLKGTKPGDLANDGFLDADTCSTCHSIPAPEAYAPMDTWAGTMMGNAARDPVFFAALAVANQDAPGVGTYCLRCHSPIGFVRGHATPPDGSAFDKIDKQGVGCETCHRARQAAAPDAPYHLSNAQLEYDEDTTKHGPYSDAVSPAHQTAQDLGLADSRFCGQCHEVTNPEKNLRDALGMDTGLEFPLDTTFTEWNASAYAPGGAAPASCIDCHMPKKAGSAPVCALPGEPARPEPREHAFVSGNHWGVLAVAQANPDRYSKYQAAFDLAAQRTLDNLAKAVKVTIDGVPAAAAPGASVDVTVKVENLTGHKFPTGYAESRRAWIAIALEGDGAETTLLGAYDPATGEIAASPETHVYRAEQGHWDGTKGVADHHLATHDMILEDTRIPPRGFVAGPTTTPSGPIDYSDGNGGHRSYDEATFTVTLPAGAYGAQKLAARVYYQSMTRAHVEALAAANTTDDTGAKLVATYQATGEAPPLLVAEANAPIDLGPAPTTSAGGGNGAGGGAPSGGGGGGGGAAAGAGGGLGGKSDAPSEDAGCGCRVGGSGSSLPAAAAALGALALAAARRKRVPRRSDAGARRSE